MISFAITQIMQNLSNFPSSTSKLNPSLEYLQEHIRELTAYINENNQKYHRNMVTLKEFYQEQNAELHQQKEELFADNSKQANQIITLRDLLATANLKLKQSQERLTDTEQRSEDIRQRLQAERQRNEKMYDQLGAVRKICQQQIDANLQTLREIQDKNRGLLASLKQKDDQIEQLNRKAQELEVRVTETFLLPGKIQEMEKEGLENGLKVKDFNRKMNQINQQLSSTKLQLERCMSENQSLRIAKGNFNSQKKLEVQTAVKRERESHQSRIKKLQAQNQSYIYQLNEAESRIKMSAKQIVALQNELKRQGQANLELSKQMAIINSEKDDYLKEFSGLKSQYEGVIQRLEDTLITYQKKNWDLEQENKDLNGQLDALQELLTEVKSMNNLQANRAEYRKLAEIEVIARQALPTVKETNFQKNEDVDKYKGEFDGEWERLMGQIDRIST